MIRNSSSLSLLRQIIVPSTFSPIGCVRTIHQKGKQPLGTGQAWVAKWTNVVGQEKLRRVMPDVMKLSRERRGHLWESPSASAEEGLEEKADGEEEAVGNPNEGNSDRDLATVPSYARFAEFRNADLNFEPSPLHCVWRCARFAGRPKYEKDILISLKLDVPIGKMVIIRNTPSINYKLWQVKHMLRIRPLKLPQGAPDADNYKGFLLKRNGELIQSRLYREKYKRERNRPDLEQFVLLREEKEEGMRKRWFHGSLDGTLLNTVSEDKHVTVLKQREVWPQLGKGCQSTHRKEGH